jgi:hypothetical protein
MRNWKANIWLTALALLPPCILGGEPQVARAQETHAIAVDELPPVAVGSLTLQWTLSGRREPLDCGGLGIDRFQVSLTSATSGGDAEPWDAPCDAFQLSIDLPPGTYTGEAVMVDRLDRAVTLNVAVEQVEVVAGKDVTKTIDFPMAAFL